MPLLLYIYLYLQIIVKGSHTRNSCGYRDYFDGTYTVCCVLREPENDIEFYLMNVNFMSYQLFYSHHKKIHEIKVDSLVAVDVRKYNLNLMFVHIHCQCPHIIIQVQVLYVQVLYVHYIFIFCIVFVCLCGCGLFIYYVNSCSFFWLSFQ